MLTLLIDNQRINLSADVSTEYYVNNPFFDKEGEHTLDIDINLNDPNNALIYKNMHRLDINTQPLNRKALLYNERGILIKGTELILEIDENKAKIQLVAGNSELNNKLGDKKITDIDLGYVEINSIDDAVASQRGSYPNYDYVCTPVCAYNDSDSKDYDVLDKDRVVSDGNTTTSKYIILNDTDVKTGEMITFFGSPQVYLGAMIKKILVYFGYKLGTNVFETDERLKKLIVINAQSWYIGVDSLPKYNKLIPNWKISDFISEVEKFANVIFDVEQSSGIINIRNVYEFYNNLPFLYLSIDHVVGNIEKKYAQNDDNKKLDMQYTNVKYNLPSDVYYKYQDIEDDILADCIKTEVIPQSWIDIYNKFNFADIWHAITNSSDFLTSESVVSSVGQAFNTMFFYKAKIFNEEQSFVLRSVDETYPCVRPCNQFSKRTTDKDKDYTTLNIVPCQMVSCRPHYNGDNSKMAQFPIPVAKWPYPTRTFKNKHDANVTTELNKYIQSGYESEVNEGDTERIYVAFYFGILPITWEDPSMNITNWKTPVASPLNETYLLHEKLNDVSSLFWKQGREINLGNELLTLSINSEHGWWNTSYGKNPRIDISVEYVINLYIDEIPDPRRIFVIGNKKFYCKQLKYIIKNKQISSIVEGTFYAVI